jgi:hypothetical protein
MPYLHQWINGVSFGQFECLSVKRIGSFMIQSWKYFKSVEKFLD